MLEPSFKTKREFQVPSRSVRRKEVLNHLTRWSVHTAGNH